MGRAPANAVDHDMIDGLLAAFRAAGEDRSVRAVVLTSALDRVFCAGMDLALMKDAGPTEFRRFLEKLYVQLYDLQYGLGKPTIAAVGGAIRGAGATLAVSCDIIVASADATIGYPEINVGLIPGIHFAHLPRQIGRHHAFELLFTGKPVSAEQAYALGMVNRVVPGSELRGAALEIASDLASKPPEVMRIARAAFMRMNDLDYRRSIEGVVDTLCSLIATPETREGILAFLEKRSPRW